MTGRGGWAAGSPGRRAEHGWSLSAAQLAGALAALQLLARRLLSWWDDHDLLLCPTLTQPPMPLGIIPRLPRDPTVVLTVPANVTGQPALSLPSTPTDDGLPVGVQLVAAPGQEEVLLRVAAELERARPWAHRRPRDVSRAGEAGPT
jgi:amidase